MSESPAHSDIEKTAYASDEKTAHDGSTPVYDYNEGVGEAEAVEFGETKELK